MNPTPDAEGPRPVHVRAHEAGSDASLCINEIRRSQGLPDLEDASPAEAEGIVGRLVKLGYASHGPFDFAPLIHGIPFRSPFRTMPSGIAGGDITFVLSPQMAARLWAVGFGGLEASFIVLDEAKRFPPDPVARARSMHELEPEAPPAELPAAWEPPPGAWPKPERPRNRRERRALASIAKRADRRRRRWIARIVKLNGRAAGGHYVPEFDSLARR